MNMPGMNPDDQQGDLVRLAEETALGGLDLEHVYYPTAYDFGITDAPEPGAGW